MKFKSRKNIWLMILLYVVVIIPTFGIVYNLLNGEIDNSTIFATVLIFISDSIILGILWFTNYEITDNKIKWRTGFLKGEILINEIKSIEILNKFYHTATIKPALARKGLLLKYNKYNDEIYISPKTNKTFINKIIEINNNIEIVDNKN